MSKKKFCISKRLLFLLGILFSIVILTTFVFYTKESITLFSKASENNTWRICAINIKTMKNTNNCCNNDELNKGHRCYRDYYSINCNTKDVVKCGRNNCNNETGLCKNQLSTITSPPVNNPTAILPTMPQYNSKPDLCDGRYLKDVNWQKTCCSDDDIKTGRFKCIETEDGTGKTIYYQFHCSAQRYWKCDGNCSKWVGLKKITYPTCNKIIESSTAQILIPTLTPTSTPKPTPTEIPLLPIEELSKTINEYLIKTYTNITKIWEQKAVLDLNNNSSQELHNIFNLLTSNNRYNDFTFSLKNDESFPFDGKFLQKDRNSPLYYVFYPYKIPSSRYGIYGSYYNWVENNSLYRWHFTGDKIIPSHSFPRVIMVDKTKNYLYLALDIDDYKVSKLSNGYPRDGEAVTSGLPCLKDFGIETESCPFIYKYSFSQFNNKIFMFIGSVSNPCVLLEIYKTENNDIVFRGMYSNDCI